MNTDPIPPTDEDAGQNVEIMAQIINDYVRDLKQSGRGATAAAVTMMAKGAKQSVLDYIKHQVRTKAVTPPAGEGAVQP